MEREKEKDLLKELNALRRQVQDQKARRDNLLRLIKKLQQIQALGPPAIGARSPSKERAQVAQAVEKYLRATDTSSGFMDTRYTTSPSSLHTEMPPLLRLSAPYSHLTRFGVNEWIACPCSTPDEHCRADMQVFLLFVDRCDHCLSDMHKTRNCPHHELDQLFGLPILEKIGVSQRSGNTDNPDGDLHSAL